VEAAGIEPASAIPEKQELERNAINATQNSRFSLGKADF
jgi:hypothetical protein